MSKREKNKSQYNQSTWTIEWQFHSTDIVLLNRRVNENSTLSSVIENHLKSGPWNHKLRPFCAEQLDCLKFFIRKYLKLGNLFRNPTVLNPALLLDCIELV
ncbi:uncharacterized protein LOC100855187 [Vitis vinifera]|uniref:uncharacterized protein LOC100855187 n=1 Tax=Vitis vinifera TaxID=29760 RepID=UPI0028830A87|nr:uncharacterized protein LOC100855187 [Vitis vinifera]